ncbi:MAG TPA: hypothetical protein VGB15_24130, partial [Longimicrobium sp.]
RLFWRRRNGAAHARLAAAPPARGRSGTRRRSGIGRHGTAASAAATGWRSFPDVQDRIIRYMIVEGEVVFENRNRRRKKQ